MGYGCITCLQVVHSICDAYYLDSTSGINGMTLREKLLQFCPDLSTDFNNACLCRNCMNMVTSFYQFRQTAFESQMKIFSFLQQNAGRNCIGIDEIGEWYSARFPPASTETKQNIKIVQTFVLQNEKFVPPTVTFIPPNEANVLPTTKKYVPANENYVSPNENYDAIRNIKQENPPEPRWEPPPSREQESNEDAIFQSPAVSNTNNSAPVSKLKCPLCNYSCDENCMHAFHMILHENPNPPYRCGRCPAEMPMRELLLDHLALHTSENPYKCPVCFFITNSYKRMKRHQDSHQKRFYCSICKERFMFEREMKMHVAEIHRSILKCDMCKYQSKNAILLAQHKRQHLMCKSCGEAFKSSMDVESHCVEKKHLRK